MEKQFNKEKFFAGIEEECKSSREKGECSLLDCSFCLISQIKEELIHCHNIFHCTDDESSLVSALLEDKVCGECQGDMTDEECLVLKIKKELKEGKYDK